METKQRATRDEIMQHLSGLLGQEAVDIVVQATSQILVSSRKDGLAILNQYDESLGGIGIYVIGETRPLGIYRALLYVWQPLNQLWPADHTRAMIHAACGYLEELLKKMVFTWPWEKIKADSLPLGTLATRIQKRLPVRLAGELLWLSQGVYNFAKHHFNLEDDDDKDPEHFFRLDEAIAVYLIVRKLGLDLEKHFGRPRDELLSEYPQ